MSITNKTRKLLWGQSGNFCAICKKKLIVEATAEDDESIVGEECHIISARRNGPRYDPSYSSDSLDSYDNLLLLCAVDHKMVDDQSATYSAEILRAMKANHKKWVDKKLSDGGKEPEPVRIRRFKQNIPEHLIRFTAGRDLLNLVHGASAGSWDHSELENEGEVELVGGFLEVLRDWADIGPELGPSDLTRTAFELSAQIKELDKAGFWVFGASEDQVMEGGSGHPTNWRVVFVKVVRKDDEQFLRVNLTDLDGEQEPRLKTSTTDEDAAE